MSFKYTVLSAGLLLVIAACSSSADAPDKTGLGRGGSGANRGAGATGNGTSTGQGGNGVDTGQGGAGDSGNGEGGSGVDTSGTGGAEGQTDTGGASSTGAGGTNGQTESGGASATGTGGASNNGGSCVSQDFRTTPAPPILEFVIDKSTSMNDRTLPSTNGQSKWEATRDALISAYASMPTDYMVGELFYPNTTNGCVAQTGVPGSPIVDIAPLSTNLAALQAAVRGVANPTDIQYTPTRDAWREGERRLQALLANPPAGYEASQGYVVLVTDGMPTRGLNCANTPGPSPRIAVTLAEFDGFIADVQASPIKTFVIGVPGSEQDSQVPLDASGNIEYVPRAKLSETAQAGFTAQEPCSNDGNPKYCHFDMVNTTDFVGDLTKALAAITTQIISCSYAVPAAPQGQFIDPNPENIAVIYTTGSGEVRELSGGDSSCNGNQWYGENPDALGIPTTIQLCASTCDTVSADAGAQVAVQFKCIYQQ